MSTKLSRDTRTLKTLSSRLRCWIIVIQHFSSFLIWFKNCPYLTGHTSQSKHLFKKVPCVFNGHISFKKTSCLTFFILHPIHSHNKLRGIYFISWSHTPNVFTYANLIFSINEWKSKYANLTEFWPLIV